VIVAPGGGSFATIAVGPGGAALAEWVTGGLDGVMMTSYRPPGGSFEPPTLLSASVPGGEQWAVADFDAAGNATIAWAGADPTNRLLVRTRSAAGAWTAPEAIAARRPFRPELMVSPSGAATLTWEEAGPKKEDASRVVVATRPPGGRFGAEQTLAGVQRNPGEPVVATNDRGDAVVAWVELHDEPRPDTFGVHAAFRAAGSGAFGRAVTLTRPDVEAAFPSVSVDPTGRMVLAFSENGPGRRVWARVRTRSGTLLPGRVLSHDHEENSGVTALAAGRGLVAWFDRDRGRSFLRIAAATPAGAFGPPRLLATTREYGDTPWLFAVPTGLLAVTPANRIVAL
jgi:hypothetical protein